MNDKCVTYRLVYTPIGLTERRELRSSVEREVILAARILTSECNPVVIRETVTTTEEILNWREK